MLFFRSRGSVICYPFPEGVFYYRPVEWTERDLQLMEKLDELFTENPTRGTRRLSQALKKRFGLVAGRDKVRRLMRTMGIAAIYPKKNLSVAHSSTQKNIRTCSGEWPSPGPIRCGARISVRHAGAVGERPTKPAGCRPAAGMLPPREGTRAEGGCQAPPCADGGVS